jgi:flagellum-specific peptidoglycan hydrolase FlgJ
MEDKRMFKKVLAMLLAGSMVMSSAAVVMAGESEVAEAESAVTTESAGAAESEATVESEATAESESTTESGTEKVEFRTLVENMLAKIEEATAGVDLEKKEEVLGKEFSEEGTVFSLFGKILTDIDERRSAEGEEEDESVKQALEAFASLDETDEEELDGLMEVVLLSLISEEVEEDIEEETPAKNLEIATVVANFVFESAEENKLIAEAVEATNSRLFDMLSNSLEKLKAAANDDGTMDVIEEIPEEPFEKFEEELAKVTDYINEQDGSKQPALDLLNLVHGVVDEIHLAVHGHTHEALE